VEARLEIGDVARMLAQQVFTELLPPVHLHREAAKVPEQFLSGFQDRLALPPQRAGRARPANRSLWRRDGSLALAALSPSASRQWKSRHERRL